MAESDFDALDEIEKMIEPPPADPTPLETPLETVLSPETPSEPTAADLQMPTKTLAEIAGETPAEPELEAPSRKESPTLAKADARHRPDDRVICRTCPNSVWMASDRAVECYCKVMMLVSWSSTKRTDLTMCDGSLTPV